MDIKNSGAWRRVLSDQEELYSEMPKQITLNWPDKENIMFFEVTIRPDENSWKGGAFAFTVTVDQEYPISAPKVLCKKVILLI